MFGSYNKETRLIVRKSRRRSDELTALLIPTFYCNAQFVDTEVKI